MVTAEQLRQYRLQFAVLCQRFPFLLADRASMDLSGNVKLTLIFPLEIPEEGKDIIQWDYRNRFEVSFHERFFTTKHGLQLIKEEVERHLTQALTEVAERGEEKSH
jgi:hypothetical protein